MRAIGSERRRDRRSATDHSIRQGLWWLCLAFAPAVLIAVELFHPAHFTAHPGMYHYLSHPEPRQAEFEALAYSGPHWWFVLHMIQTPMVGMVAVGLWLMVDSIGGEDGTAAMACAWLARAATLVFVIYYTVLDAIGGIGLGRTIVVVERLVAEGRLDPAQFKGIVLLLDTMWTDRFVGGMGSFVSHTGSWAAFASSVLIAAALLLAGRAGWPSMLLLVAFGWELRTTHASPHGPIAFALLIAASAWLWWTRRRVTS